MDSEKMDEQQVEERTFECVDFGDAMIETRQGAPGGIHPDSKYGWGIWPG